MSTSMDTYNMSNASNMTAEQVGIRPQTPKSALEHFREYGRERPEVVALWCFGVGFVLGWKLKLW